MNIGGVLTAILAGLFMGTMGVFSRKIGLDAKVITFFRLLFGSGFHPLCNYCPGKLPAATFGTLAYFEPICVVIFGWMIFGETLNSLQLAGCLFIIASGAVKGYLTTHAIPAIEHRELSKAPPLRANH